VYTTTTAKGSYSFSFSIPTQGTYTLQASFSGDSSYTSSYASLPIPVGSLQGTTSSLTVTNITPAEGATNVPLNATVTLTFSEKIQPGPGFGDIRLFNYFGGLNTTISGNVLTITPEGDFQATAEGTSAYGAHIGIYVPADAVKDANTNTMTSYFDSDFTLTTPISAISINPADGSSQVPVNQSIVITFNTAIKPGPGFNEIFNGNTWTPINKSINGNTLTLTPVGNWLYGALQWVIIPKNGVTDSNGTSLTGDWDTSFTTVSSPAAPSGALYVTSVDPRSTATNVPTNTQITVTFNTNVQAGPTFNGISISGYNGTLTGYSGSLVKTISGKQLVINPVAGLTAGSVYTITIPAGAVTDGAGHNLAMEYDGFFATAGQKLNVTAVDPPEDATNVSLNKTISVTFNEAIQPGPGFDYIRVYNYFGQLNMTISGNTLYIQPSGEWLFNQPHDLVIPNNAVIGASGDSLTLLFYDSFWTTGQVSVSSINPSDGATNVPVNQIITLTFNTAIQPGPGFNEIQVEGYSGSLYMTISGNTLTLTPLGKFSGTYMYHVFVPAGSIQSTSGVSLGGDFESYFTPVGSS